MSQVPTIMVSFSDSSTFSTENGFETGIWKLADGFRLVPFLTREKPFGSWGLSAPLPTETFLVRVGLVLLLSRWKLVGFSDFLSLSRSYAPDEGTQLFIIHNLL